MPASLDQMTKDWRGALVIVDDGQTSVVRPAAFVFDRPGGMVWVEPSYADPSGAASPAAHARTGDVEASGPGAVLRTNVQTIAVMPYANGQDEDLVGDALVWFADWLRAEGRTWAQERERVQIMLGDMLA